MQIFWINEHGFFPKFTGWNDEGSNGCDESEGGDAPIRGAATADIADKHCRARAGSLAWYTKIFRG